LVDFVSKKLTIEVSDEKDFNGIIAEATAIVKKIEPDIKVVNAEKSKGRRIRGSIHVGSCFRRHGCRYHSNFERDAGDEYKGLINLFTRFPLIC
jgi:hypothetical protein